MGATCRIAHPSGGGKSRPGLDEGTTAGEEGEVVGWSKDAVEWFCVLTISEEKKVYLMSVQGYMSVREN
jgi:hypothetical protein